MMIGGKLKAACPFLVLAAMMLLPCSTLAQTVNPTQAYFDRSADHDATDSNGTPLVQSYQLQLYLVGASAPFQVVSLGKPTPDALGVINVDLRTIFMGWPVPGTNYFANVAAVGPGGNTASAPSNTFSFSGSSCSFTVSPTSHGVVAAGGSLTTSVTTTSGCAWSVASNAVWITVVGGSSRTGSGTVTYTVAANTASSLRTGTLTVAGQTVTVTQSGSCSFTVSPTSHSVAAAGGSPTTSVTTTSGCAWSVTSNAVWITVVGGSSRTGSGTVTSTVAANTASSLRTGTLTIAAQTVTVTEAAAPGTPPSAPPNLRIVSP